MSNSATPRTVAHQAPLSMGFSRKEYWSGSPCPSPGDLPDPGIKPRSPALQADALPSEPPGKLTGSLNVELFQMVSTTFPSIIILNPMEFRSQTLSMGSKLSPEKGSDYPKSWESFPILQNFPPLGDSPGNGPEPLCQWDLGQGRGGGQKGKRVGEVKVSVAQPCLTVTPQTAAHQAPLSMGFSRQEHQSLAIPFLRGSSQPRFPALWADSLSSEPPESGRGRLWQFAFYRGPFRDSVFIQNQPRGIASPASGGTLGGGQWTKRSSDDGQGVP